MKKYIAEFTGTLFLVLIACGVAVASGGNYLGTALAFGLVLIAMSYTISSVSGCHINPSVTLSMLLVGRMKWKEGLKYILAQVLGAIVGAFLLGVIMNDFTSLGANAFSGDVTVWIALLVEALLTFVFVLLILVVTDKKEHSAIAGLIIGLTLIVVHLFGIPFTGTSVNPARSIGPALIEGTKAFEQLWVFIVGPLLGSFLAAGYHKYVLSNKKLK